MSDIKEIIINNLDVSTETRIFYMKVIDLFFRWIHINKLDINKITTEHIIDYKQYLMKSCQPKTVNTYLSVIRAMYNILYDKGLYNNIAHSVKKVKEIHTFKRFPLSIEEINLLLNSIDRNTEKGYRDYLLIKLMILTGLRRIEINRINKDDIIIYRGKHVINIQRKGHSSKDQYIVITDELYNDITQLININKESIINSGPLFTSLSPRTKDDRLSTDSISRIIKHHLNNIGLKSEQYCAHSLRHSMAVIMFELGYDIYFVQDKMGHASSATTQIYMKSYKDKIAFDDKGIKSLQNLIKIKN